MLRRNRKTPIVALLWLLLNAPLFGETFLVIVQEYRGGERQGLPLASQEGLMSAMFDLGHITFETGLYRPEMSWDGMKFDEPLRLARDGGAGYLAVVRVFAESHPEDKAPGTGRHQFSSRAEFVLLDAVSSRLLGRGELETSSAGAARELTYDEFLFVTGEKIAVELAKLCGVTPER